MAIAFDILSVGKPQDHSEAVRSSSLLPLFPLFPLSTDVCGLIKQKRHCSLQCTFLACLFQVVSNRKSSLSNEAVHGSCKLIILKRADRQNPGQTKPKTSFSFGRINRVCVLFDFNFLKIYLVLYNIVH